MSYVYDEDGTLIAQTLAGGASTTWGQSARYIYLPTASGPMPVVAIYGTKHYAIQSDHLNTPRRLVQSDSQVAWQWAYSAFGDEQPTIAKNRFANVALNQAFGTTTVPSVTFNLRYPGQYFDQESGLHYNYHRSYSATTGRYTQSDPIGLDGGWNRFGCVDGNPLSFTDPLGLQAQGAAVACGLGFVLCACIITAATWGVVNSSKWVDNPQAAAEHQAYSPECRLPDPPGLFGCELLKWKLAREEYVVGAMIAWDAKWSPGHHANDISARRRSIEKLKQEIKDRCED